MQESKKALIIIIISLLVLAGVIYFFRFQRNEGSKIIEKGKIEEGKNTATPNPVIAPENVGAGKVGETEKTLKGEERVVLPAEPGGPAQVLPPAIFNDSGEIKEVKKDSIIILSSGYSFADQKPRQLILKYTASTRTNNRDRTKFWTGFDGLNNLKVGNKITFESLDNIRGKTEFEVSYVNQL